MDSKHSEQEHHGYGIYLVTWLSLLVLTAVTVSVAGMNLGSLSILTALAIASLKAAFVLYFFMHLKEESAVFKTMFFVYIGTFVIFISLTFVDILHR